jgi:hypothetical protein
VRASGQNIALGIPGEEIRSGRQEIRGHKLVFSNIFRNCPGRMLHEAQVVVVGADDSETSFAFDALVENEEGQICTQ